MKNKYTVPKVTIHQLILESGIATGSAYINVGQNPDYRPEVEEWNDANPDTETYGTNL